MTSIAPSGDGGWMADTLDPTWCRAFTEPELAALDHAVTTFAAAQPDLDPAALDDDVFPLGVLSDHVADVRRRLIDGDGVAAYVGVPVERYRETELRAMWWGLSRAIGTPVSQSHRGDLIGDVRDLGTGISGPVGRGYTSNTELNFHADNADVSGLFFLRTARTGGVNRISSSVAVHDTIAERRPDLLAELYRPLPWSWQGNQPPGEQGWYEMPVFGRRADEVSCAFVRTNIVLAHANAGAPELTPRQAEAVAYLAEVAAEDGRWVERRFDPGAMLWVHNHTAFHLRTAFEDWDQPERRRHLLRVWVSPPNNRALPESFASFFGDVNAGAVRGGYASRAEQARYTTV